MLDGGTFADSRTLNPAPKVVLALAEYLKHHIYKSVTSPYIPEATTLRAITPIRGRNLSHVGTSVIDLSVYMFLFPFSVCIMKTDFRVSVELNLSALFITCSV